VLLSRSCRNDDVEEYHACVRFAAPLIDATR